MKKSFNACEVIDYHNRITPGAITLRLRFTLNDNLFADGESYFRYGSKRSFELYDISISNAPNITIHRVGNGYPAILVEDQHHDTEGCVIADCWLKFNSSKGMDCFPEGAEIEFAARLSMIDASPQRYHFKHLSTEWQLVQEEFELPLS